MGHLENDVGKRMHDSKELNVVKGPGLSWATTTLAPLSLLCFDTPDHSNVLRESCEKDAEMGSYAQQFGSAPVWYYQDETPRPPPPLPPVVPARYVPQSGDVFSQPGVYTPMYAAADQGIPIQTPTTSFGTPRHYDNANSGVRQESSPSDGVDRRRYRIKRIRTASTLHGTADFSLLTIIQACETCRARKQRRVYAPLNAN